MDEHYHSIQPSLYFLSVGLKFGPARDALEEAASELGLLGLAIQAGSLCNQLARII